MKTLIVLITLMSLILAVPVWSLGHQDQPGATTAKEPKVYCCHKKNDCDKLHTRAECEKEGGKVVKTCKECK
jgi:hypothetical protein